MTQIWTIPVLVLIGAAVFVFLINRDRPNIGAAWFISVLASLFVWGWTVVLYWRSGMSQGQIIQPGSDLLFRLFQSEAERLSTGELLSAADRVFVLDRIAYPYLLSAASLLLILLLTAPSYMDPQVAPRLWFFYLLVEAVGYLAVSANGVLPVVYCWVIFDALDLLSQYAQARPGGIRRSFLTAIFVRSIGTMLAILAVCYSAADLSEGVSVYISPAGGRILLLGCALRMGILPLSQPYGEMDTSRVGLGTMLRLMSILTVMPVLSRTPMSALSLQTVHLLSIFGGAASIVGALGWLLSPNASSGNTYAALAICGMAFVCALSGEQQSLIAWGVSIVLTCAPLSLYQVHNPLMNILAGLLITAFSGLPYMPNAIGWTGLVHAPYSIKDLLFIIVMALLITGAFTHVLRTAERKFSDLEPWMRSVYPLGFITALGTHVFISMITYDRPFSMGVIPASVTAFVLGIALTLLGRHFPGSQGAQNLLAWGREGVSLFWRWMQRIMDMEWLIRSGSWISSRIGQAVAVVSGVLENNGGLIWEILMLALLLAVVFSGSGI